MEKFLALSLSVVEFITLINVKWHFKIYEQDKFYAQLSWVWKKVLLPRGPDSVVDKKQTLFIPHWGFLTYAMHHRR